MFNLCSTLRLYKLSKYSIVILSSQMDKENEKNNKVLNLAGL